MKTGKLPLVIGNWKMNPQSVTLSTKLALELKKNLQRVQGAHIVVAPPFTFLDAVREARGSSKVFSLGAQNVHHEKLGARTGEVSLPMLKSFGVTHVILGHSERRASGETDKMVHQKILSTLKEGLVAVVCVGELKRDTAGHYLSHIESQIREALRTVPRSKLGQVVIAYEPIWAIGTGNNATVEDVHEMKIFIEKVIADLYGRTYAQKMHILYGGSVSGKNATELFTGGMVDGFLVGGASLHAEEFAQIVKSARSV